MSSGKQNPIVHNTGGWIRDTNKRVTALDGQGSMGPSAIVGLVDALYGGAGIPAVTLVTDVRVTVHPVSFPTGMSFTPGQQVVLVRSQLGWHILRSLSTVQTFNSQIPLAPYMVAAGSIVGDYADALSVLSDVSQPWHRGTISRTSAGMVAMIGLLFVPGAVTANTVLFTIPVQFRPLQQKRLAAVGNGNVLSIIVETNGNVYSDVALTAGVFISLGGLCWTNDSAIVWTNLVLNSAQSWVASTATNAATARVGKDSVGRVWFEGYVKGGATATGIAPIPAGFRWTGIAGLNGGNVVQVYELGAATRNARVDAPASSGAGVAPNQSIIYESGNTPTTGISLDQISYAADPAVYDAVTLTNGTVYGNGYDVPGIYSFSDGGVRVKGLMATATVGSAQFFAKPGQRVLQRARFINDDTNAPGSTDFTPGGGLIVGQTVGGFVSFANIQYIAEA